MKITSFECPKSIRNYEKENTLNIRHLVDESFVQLAQQTNVLSFAPVLNCLDNCCLVAISDLKQLG